MGKAYLVMRLDGLLQSYGVFETERNKTTSLFPTKSSIVGMLGSAFGYDRTEKEKLAELSNSFVMGARWDRGSSKLVDFQSITGRPSIAILLAHKGEFSKKEKLINREYLIQGHLKVDEHLNNSGCLTPTSETKLVNKEYMCDCAYTVILEGEKEFLISCEKALRNPKWSISLGRNKCIPSTPIVSRKGEDMIFEFNSMREALETVSLCPYSDYHEKYWCEVEVTNPLDYEDGTIKKQYDVYVSSTAVGSSSYGERYIYRDYVTINCVKSPLL